jgi:hypothetical protein
VYVEIIIIIFVVLRHVLNMIVSIFTVSFNVIEYKANVISLITEIPAMLLIILTVGRLAYINTLDNSLGIRILYFSTSALLIIIYRILYQGDIYEIANKRDDYLLWYYGRRFFKITYWIYLIFFLILISGLVNNDNPIATLCFNIVHWFLTIKYIGWLIPWVAGLMVIGSIKIALFGSLALIMRKNKSMTHQT